MQKTLPLFLLAFIAVGGGSFYGGMKYQENKSPTTRGGRNAANLYNLSPEERQAFQGMRGVGVRGGAPGGGGAVAGDIITTDDKSITVKLRDGGSKIVFLSDATEISKFATGTKTDLTIGTTVTARGNANPDGSVTAQSVQIRPTLPTPSAQ